MKRTLHITLETTGDISIEAVGFHGADCERATAFLEQALGVTTTKERKPEYHQAIRTLKRQSIGS